MARNLLSLSHYLQAYSPTPYTPHQDDSALHVIILDEMDAIARKRQPLNSQPSTLNPEPWTLNPEP